MTKYILTILLVFASAGYSYSQVILATSTELVLQVQNADSTHVTDIKYSSVTGTAVVYSTNCTYSAFDDFSFTHEITGNNTADDYFASIKMDVSSISIFEMVHAKIKIEFIVGTTVKKVLYYDTRDCQYYTACEYKTGDVTVRYDYGEDKLWFKKGVVQVEVANTANGWEEITSGATKNFWDVRGLEHCSITQPQRPTGLAITNSGGHPRLDWNANTESDLASYKVYKKDGTSYFQLIGTTTNTYYIDGSETIDIKQQPQMYIQYYVKAYNNGGEYSFPSDEEQIQVVDNNAQKRQYDNEVVVKEKTYGIGQNYPNPFNPSTIIQYSIKNNSHVYLAVYNSVGEHVQTLVNEFKAGGRYEENFDGADLANGIYYYKIITNDFVESKKMVILK